MKAIPYHAIANDIGFSLPSELGKNKQVEAALSVPFPSSWWGHEKMSPHGMQMICNKKL